ncbi:MAG: hypothetical protein LBQ14_05765 [Treponema sp.]|nr:hypothetical protein [Treponema sp.]
MFFEDVGIEDTDITNAKREERFPPLKKRSGKNFKHLPPLFTKIYQEAITAYNNNAYILCAAGIRILKGRLINTTNYK